MLETQGYAQAQDAKREKPSQREVYLVVLTGLYPGRGDDSWVSPY